MKKLIALILVLLFSLPVEAKPWYKKWESWLIIGISEGAATASIYSASACRHQNGIGPCQGGYGEIRARNGLNLVGAAAFPALSLWGRHLGVKEWILPTAGYDTWNTYEAIHQRLISCPYDQHFLYGTKKTCVPNSTYDGW